MAEFPPALYLPNGSSIVPFDEEPWEEIKKDPRGILLMFHPPVQGHRYVMGMDSSVGITGWNRGMRTPQDRNTDNGAIVVYDIGGESRPAVTWDQMGHETPDIDPDTKLQKIQRRDVQVCEFAAPCDAVEIARVADVIGRIYVDPEGEPCELIWEAYPGCGMLTTQELLRIGYPNLWMWEYIDNYAEQTSRFGWRSGFQSLSILWTRTRRHLMQRNVAVRSKWLREEYASAKVDVNKMRARAENGAHDDLMMASNLALWAGHRWTYQMEEDRRAASEVPIKNIDMQNYAPVLGEELQSYAEWRASAMDDWDME